MSKVSYETITRDLAVKLSDEEVDQKSQELARCVGDIEAVTEEAKDSAKEFKRRLDEKKKSLHDLAKAVSNREERRSVLCSERPNARLFRVETVRHDTMEIIETRAMKGEELDEARQGSLFERHTADSSDLPEPTGSGPEVLNTVRAPDTSIPCPGRMIDGVLAGCAGAECGRCAGHGTIPVDSLDSNAGTRLVSHGFVKREDGAEDEDTGIDDPEALLAAAEEGEDALESDPH